MSAKFKVGETVKCIKPKPGQEGGSGTYGGAGWLENYVFKITAITGEFIYWGGNEKQGVFEPHLELATTPQILKTYRSGRSPNKTHKIIRGKDGVIYCTCTGWKMYRKCKHLADYYDHHYTPTKSEPEGISAITNQPCDRRTEREETMKLKIGATAIQHIGASNRSEKRCIIRKLEIDGDKIIVFHQHLDETHIKSMTCNSENIDRIFETVKTEGLNIDISHITQQVIAELKGGR